MAIAPPPDMPADLILWDVVEEHLDEAEFLFERWEAALVSPIYTLDEVAKGPEERLLAHIDGLVVGGSAVAERLLIPALEETDPEDPTRTTAAAFALLEGGPRWYGVVLAALASAEGERQNQIVRALGLATRPELDARLLAATAAAKPECLAPCLAALAARQLDPGAERLRMALRSEDAAAHVAGLRACRGSAEIGLVDVEPLVQSPDPLVREEAVTTGLMLGSGRAWDVASRCVRGESTPPKYAMLLTALLGGRTEHRVLLGFLQRSETVADAIWALGFTGNRECIEACLPFLSNEDERLARLAGEAVAAYCGLDLSDVPYGRDDAPLDDDDDDDNDDEGSDGDAKPDDDESLLPAVEHDLPLPNADEIRRWWREDKPTYAAKRVLLGKALSWETVAQALREGPRRRCTALALHVALRSGGKHRVDCGALSRQQRTQVNSVDSVRFD